MLAAVPNRSGNSLDLFRLVLSMVATDNQGVPPQLKDLLVGVIDEAKELAQDPQRRASVEFPESILLALEMREEQDLATTVREITTFDSIRPELANRVLSLMEHHPA